MAIRTFRHKGLRQLWAHDDTKGVPGDGVAKLRRMMAALHRSSGPEQLAAAALPGWRVHALKGDLAGYWSLTVTGNWRLLARFKDGDVVDLDLVDYY